ncbi:hypothetical protein fHeYen902_082c [Yersinia phage fHe-Yen9-02]|nr:hypothetical protein fHeYen902_082c [Yersinia phage fHe-Yen9-02]
MINYGEVFRLLGEMEKSVNRIKELREQVK